MASTISASWLALYNAFVAETGTGESLEGVQITAGPPSEFEDQEVVSLLGWGDPEEESARIGGTNDREERYRIEVGVKAHDPSGTSFTVAARLLAIVDALRVIVKANKRLTGEVMCQVVRRRSDGPRPALGPDGSTSAGWVCFDLIEVECWAYGVA